MPPTRDQPLNPRLAPEPQPVVPVAAVRHAPAPRPVATPAPAPEPFDEVEARAEEARAGGFHESSYELKQGLDIVESEWPADITTPGALGPR